MVELSGHDVVLAVIPASLLLAGAVGALLSPSMGVMLTLGAVPASGTVGYALFYNPPESPASNSRSQNRDG